MILVNARGAAARPLPRHTGRGAALWRDLSETKTELADRGVSFAGVLQADGSHVFAGGVPRALTFDGQYLWDLNLTVDTRALFGWRGGTLFLDAQSHAGPSVDVRQVPAIADPDNMDARAETSLDRAWYQQDLESRRLRVRIGLMYVDDQFLTVPFGEHFVSLDFSSNASISAFVLPTYPRGAWGGDAFAYPTRSLSFALGVFRDDATELPYNPHGTLIITEGAWRGARDGLPVKLQVGGWVDEAAFRRFSGGIVHHAAGAYLVASGTLWRQTDDRGIGAFLEFGRAPPALAFVRQNLGVGIAWTGPWSARPHDQFGIAYARSELATHAGFTQDFESEIEAYYRFAVSPDWSVQPDIEYWAHPGGGDTPSTVLGLVRVTLAF